MERTETDLRHAAYLVRTQKCEHVRVGELVILRGSTFDVLHLALRRYRELYDRETKPDDPDR